MERRMKNIKITFFIFAIAAISLACALQQTGATPTTNNSTNPTTSPERATLPPEPVILTPAVNGELAFSSLRGDKWGVMVMNADGSNEVNLTTQFGEYSFPAWSADGQRLAMRMDFGTGSGIAIMDLQTSNGMLSGNQPTAITDKFSDSPTWSPDGNQVIYKASGDFGWQLFRYTVDSRSTTLIENTSPWIQYPKWSPDGQRILFAADTNNDGNQDIFTANIDGSGTTQLTNNPYYEGTPNWSPDGKQIVFASKGSGNLDLYIMNMDGSGMRQLTRDPADESNPSWSPDGARIAYVSNRNENNDGNSEIYVINVDGSAEMRLTNNHNTDNNPTWRPVSSANGQSACKSQAGSVVDVSIPAGTRFTGSTNFYKVWRLENSGQCTWTPNAFRLKFIGGDLLDGQSAVPLPGAIQPGSSVDIVARFISPGTPGVYVSDWEVLDAGGNPVPDKSGKAVDLNISIEVLKEESKVLPAPLFYLSAGEKAQIWRMDSDGRTITQLTNEPGGISGFEVNPANNSLAYISGFQLILLDPLNGGRQVLVSGDENHHPHDPVFSSDGKILAYGLDGIHLRDLPNGEDRLVLADNPTMSASERRIYSPRAWSPDDTKLALTIGYWEWHGSGIMNSADGSLLSEFEYGDTESWSNDSQTYFSANATEADVMISTVNGLFSIPATTGATQKALITDTFIWSPRQAPDGRLIYFEGSPEQTIPGAYHISLVITDQDGVSNKQILRKDILHLTASGFVEAAWSPDGYFLAAHLFHPTSKTSEIILLGLGDTPNIYLIQEASNLRFGK
jgi:TolB protein